MLFTLTILLTSKDGILAEAAYPVSMASGDSDHKLEIKDVIFSPEGDVDAGKAFLATVKVQNKGTKDEEDVKVKVAIPELGVSASAFIDEVEAEDEDDDIVISEELLTSESLQMHLQEITRLSFQLIMMTVTRQ